MGSIRRSLGFLLRYRSTGPLYRSTGFFIFGQPESMHFGSGHFWLSRSIGVKDRSTGLPQIGVFVLLAQSQPLDHLMLHLIRDFAHPNPKSDLHSLSTLLLLPQTLSTQTLDFSLSPNSISQFGHFQAWLKKEKVKRRSRSSRIYWNWSLIHQFWRLGLCVIFIDLSFLLKSLWGRVSNLFPLISYAQFLLWIFTLF